MAHRPRQPLPVIVPRPDRVRTLDRAGFGWLDARLKHDGWLRIMTPLELAVYAFLCLAADRQGVSFYRRKRIADELGLGGDAELFVALGRLRELDLIAYRPFRAGAADGFHQVLSLPADGPACSLPADAACVIEQLASKTRPQA